MTNEPHTAEVADAAQPTPAEPDETGERRPVEDDASAAPGAGILAVLAVVWLTVMLRSAYAAISSATVPDMALTSTAYALPGAVSASLVAGAGVALALVNAVARRAAATGTVATAARRRTLATLAGLVTGLLAATAVLLTYGDSRTVIVVAGAITTAGAVGGAVAGIRPARPVAAAVAGALAVFTVGFLLNLFEAPLLRLFGSADSQASQASALGWFALTASVSSGVAAGLVSFGYLRRTQRHPGAGGLRWPAYAAAGAGPGLLLVATEVIARTAGARVLALAGSVSEADRVGQSWLGGSRVNNALIVLFIGAVVAIIAVGRTLRPTADQAPADQAPAD